MFSLQPFLLITLASTSLAIQAPEWQPLSSHEAYGDPYGSQSSLLSHDFLHGKAQAHSEIAPSGSGGQCDVYKVGFTQDLYFQYIQYKVGMPELKEFTLCFWAKYTNHSNDHPIFSYAVDGQPRAIYSWISNTDRSSYISMAVEGHTFYRLNYPLRLNRWYHTCQSWNSKTGEWQIWVNAERVGRGFHNRLVGTTIPSGGIAITGQEQTQIGGGFQEGHEAPKGSGGMLGEITMLQFYSVALTAGKAHKDHKHHHAHQYDHNGRAITTPAPTTPAPRQSLPTHPLLTSGQRNPMIQLNFAGGQPTPSPQPQLVNGQAFNVQYLNGQFVDNLVSRQLSSGKGPQTSFAPTKSQIQSFFGSQQEQPSDSLPLTGSGLVHPSLVNPANVQFIDNTESELDTHQLFKREHTKVRFGDRIKREESKKNKRELFLAGGTILEDNSNSYDDSLLDGLAGIGDNQPILQQQKQNDEREPAEAESKAVLNVCSGCDEEPFEKALVFGWRTVPKKLYSGAFYTAAVPQCRVF